VLRVPRPQHGHAALQVAAKAGVVVHHPPRLGSGKEMEDGISAKRFRRRARYWRELAEREPDRDKQHRFRGIAATLDQEADARLASRNRPMRPPRAAVNHTPDRDEAAG